MLSSNGPRVLESGPIKAGTMILAEKPFAFVLSSRLKGQRCDHCLAKGKVLKCSICQFVHYCGRVCQKDAWPEHKWECPLLKRISPEVIPSAARLMAKIINLLAKGDGYSRRGFYTQNNFRIWRDLMAHYSDIKADKERMEHFTSLCIILHEFLTGITIPNSYELMGIYGKMCINSFKILDPEHLTVGTGIYLAGSIVDHSCNPNAIAIFDGTTLNIRTLVDLPSLDWSKIFFSYLESIKIPLERQTELLKTFYFLCQCDKCSDIEQMTYLHAAKCPNKSCDGPITIPWKKGLQLYLKPEDIDDGKVLKNGICNGKDSNTECLPTEIECKKCSNQIAEADIKKFIDAMEFTEMHLRDMKNTSVADVDVCKICLEKQKDLLHPFNTMRLATLDLALEVSIRLQQWQPACTYAKLLIPAYRFYHGDYHPVLGFLLMTYGKILLVLGEFREALSQLQRAEAIYKNSHGQKHTVYREMLMPLLRQAAAES